MTAKLSPGEAQAVLDALSIPDYEMRELTEHNPELAAAVRKLKRWARA